MLSSFLFHNCKIESYLQITSVDIKDFREGAILYSVETTWQSLLLLFYDLGWHLALLMTFPFIVSFSQRLFPPRVELEYF